MKHQMRLDPEPFQQIRCGSKSIELRLQDEKRQAISVGDEIEFTNTEDKDQVLTVRVIALHKFANFEELYRTLPLLKCGYDASTIADARPEDMEIYYSKEKQAYYGVVGIEFALQTE